MSKENANNTEKVISNATIEEILAGLKNANDKVIYNVTMEKILASLKELFTQKTNKFNAGTFALYSGYQECFCGFAPRKINIYIDSLQGVSNYDGFPLCIWEDGNLSVLPDFEGSDFNIEINPDGFTFFCSEIGTQMYLRWEAYA